MGLAHDRQEVMLAEADEPNVFHEQDLIILLCEQCFKMPARITVQPVEDLGIHARDAIRSLLEPLALRVFTHRQQDFADRAANSIQIHRVLFPRQFNSPQLALLKPVAVEAGADASLDPGRRSSVTSFTVSQSQFGTSENRRFIVGGHRAKINQSLASGRALKAIRLRQVLKVEKRLVTAGGVRAPVGERVASRVVARDARHVILVDPRMCY